MPADVEQTFGLIEWAGKARRLNEAIEAQPAEVMLAADVSSDA